LTEFLEPDTGRWVNIAPFTYAGGSTQPPLLLRDLPEQNYLDGRIRAFGLSLMAVALLFVALSALWVFLNRQHSVVIAAQPIFLYTICFGSAILAFDIWIISLDESYGWDNNMLDGACTAVAWLDSVGHMLIYLAIFTKVSQPLLSKTHGANN
jgi:hypothetical protein